MGFFRAIYQRSNMAGAYTAAAEISATVLGEGGGGGRPCVALTAPVRASHEQKEDVGPLLVPVLLPGCS